MTFNHKIIFIAFSVSRKRQEKKSFIVLFIVVITFLVCNSTRVVDNIYFTIYPYSREHVHFCQQQDKYLTIKQILFTDLIR